MKTRTAWLLAPLALLAACSDSGGGKPAGETRTMRFSGKVHRDTGAGQPSALSGAEVRLSVDRNGDGALSAGELVAVESGSEGTYAAEIEVAAGQTVVLRFSSGGTATVVRAVRGAPGGDMLVSATLRELDELDCEGSSCSGASGVRLAGLPDGTTGAARAFNPVTETGAFPGDFSDSDGNLLQSGVFATFALEDGTGAPLEELPAPATLKMKLPRDTWPLVRDITPGNGVIDVPLYAFDEVKGTWVREGTGHVEDQDGNVLEEAAAASIREGTFAGTPFAVGEVGHFSTWNCDWPVDTHGNVGGTLGECWWNGERKPCAGATVTARGESYTGSSTPQTVGADGRFAIDVMRSEAEGEDLDGDGLAGEPTTVRVRVVWEGRVYELGTHTLPATASTGGEPTEDLGTIVLSDANLLEAAICTVSGTARTVDGAPAAGASVFAWDEELPEEALMQLCTTGSCSLVAEADAAGGFSLDVPMMGGLTLIAMNERELGTPAAVETASGLRTLQSCPAAPVSVTLDQGIIWVTPTLTWNGAQLAWTPAGYGASGIQVWSGGALKWFLMMGDEGNFPSPLTYGAVPPGAIQLVPAEGGPAALASGDEVSVFLSGTAANGFDYGGVGSLTVP